MLKLVAAACAPARLVENIQPFRLCEAWHKRKGWLFTNSVAGANAAATIFSLIETCKYHGVEPYNYFRYILNILPQCQTIDDYEKLLPYKIDKASLEASVKE